MMVRPTESEKDIQNLTEIEPEKFRAEFMDQVNNLRKKIYSRVKAKVFKGKPLNGQGFLVLCKLLCNALNEGESLNIDNSWVAVCKIECDKIARELGDKYEHELKIQLDKKIYSEKELEEMGKSTRAEILALFRKRAIGDNIKEYEDKLSSSLEEKTALIKEQYLEVIKSKLATLFEDRIEDIETKLHNREYKKFGGFISEFLTLKNELELEYSDVYSKMILLDNMIIKLINMTEVFVEDNTTSNHHSDIINQEKVKNFESLITSMKEDYEVKSQDYINKFKELEAEKAKYKAEANILDEKLRNLKEEKESQKAQFEAKMADMTKSFQEREIEMKQQINQLKEQNRVIEREKNELSADHDKKFAVQSQQLQFNDMQLKTLSKTVGDLKKELQSERNSHRSSIRALEDIKKMIELSPIRSTKNKIDESVEIDSDKYKELTEENEELRKQIAELREKMENDLEQFYEQKKDYERNMRDIERKYKEKQSDDEFTINNLQKRLKTFEDADFALLETNKNLSIALERADTRCFNLEKKFDKLKKYQKIVKNACDISCKFCKKLIKKNLFVAHLEICMQNEERSYYDLPYHPPSTIAKKEEDNNNYSPSFSVSVGDKHSTEAKFKIQTRVGHTNKSLVEVQSFAELIKSQFKENVPKCLNDVLKMTSDISEKSESRLSQAGSLIQEILSSLAKNPSIRESDVFQEFIEPQEDNTKYSNTLAYSTDETVQKTHEEDYGVLDDHSHNTMSNVKPVKAGSNRYIDDGTKSYKKSESPSQTNFKKGRTNKKKILIDTEGLDEDPSAKENHVINN